MKKSQVVADRQFLSLKELLKLGCDGICAFYLLKKLELQNRTKESFSIMF